MFLVGKKKICGRWDSPTAKRPKVAGVEKFARGVVFSKCYRDFCKKCTYFRRIRLLDYNSKVEIHKLPYLKFEVLNDFLIHLL